MAARSGQFTRHIVALPKVVRCWKPTGINPLLAEPLFLARYIEKAGTGTLDMIELCRRAGLPPPEFRQEHGQLIQTLRRPTPPDTPPIGAQDRTQVTGQVTTQDNPRAGHPDAQTCPFDAGQVTGQVSPDVERLLGIIDGELTRQEIQDRLDLKGRDNFEKRYRKPALGLELIELTVPEKPTSRFQKYRLTAKGRAWLAARKTS